MVDSHNKKIVEGFDFSDDDIKLIFEDNQDLIDKFYKFFGKDINKVLNDIHNYACQWNGNYNIIDVYKNKKDDHDEETTVIFKAWKNVFTKTYPSF